MSQPQIKQLDLDDKERGELFQLIQRHWETDSPDLIPRSKAMVRWVKLWRQSSDVANFPGNEGSNFHIPLILWQILNSVAKELSALFGEDNEVVVKPRGKMDAKRVTKVRNWMNYRIQTMNLFRKYYDFAVMKRIFGTAMAFLQWEVKKRTIKQLITEEVVSEERQTDPVTGLEAIVPVTKQVVREVEKEVVDYEGIKFEPENIEDWVIPKSATDLEDADHFIRKLAISVEDILDMRDQGKLDVKLFEKDDKLVDNLYGLAATKKTSTQAYPDAGGAVRQEKDAQSGLPSAPLGSEDKIVLLNWFGKFRFRGKDGKKKERPEPVVAFVSPDLHLLLGACRLVDIYPDGRLPFIKSDLIRDPNRFWSIGLPELLESISGEMDALHNITTDAGMAAVGPMGAYKPMSGFKPDKIKYEAWTLLPLADPEHDLKFFNMGQFNAQPYILFMQQLLAMAERLTGHTEAEMGRQFSGPNAPRTYGQQAMLEAKSSERILLDLNLERESFREFLRRVWEADKRWLPKPYFFRVTEESEGDTLTDEDMIGDYDFDIGPPTSISNRAQTTQDLMQAYALAVQSPVGQQNPGVLIALFKRVMQRLGHGDVAAMIPDPESQPRPVDPNEENVIMLQGGDVHVNPMDNHAQHIAVHEGMIYKLEASEKDSPGFLLRVGGHDVITRIKAHIAEHEQAQSSPGSMSLQRGGGQQPGGGMVAGGASPQFGDLSQIFQQSQQPQQGGGNGQSQTNPLAGLLNSGRTNLG